MGAGVNVQRQPWHVMWLHPSFFWMGVLHFGQGRAFFLIYRSAC